MGKFYFIADYDKNVQLNIQKGLVFKCIGTILHSSIKDAIDYGETHFNSYQIYCVSVYSYDTLFIDGKILLNKESKIYEVRR